MNNPQNRKEDVKAWGKKKKATRQEIKRQSKSADVFVYKRRDVPLRGP